MKGGNSMIVITEVANSSHVFSLSDGSVLRLFARQSIPISESLISNEIRAAEKMKLIYLSNSIETAPLPEFKKANSKPRRER